MRKDNNILPVVAGLLIGVMTASCSEDTYTGDGHGNDAVRIATATVGTPTRANADATGFDNGDAFMLSTSEDGTTNTATYTLGTDGWSSTAPLLWGSTFPVTYYAAYPAATATYGSFTLPADQSSGTANANYMTASIEAKEKTALQLAFAHKTALVIVKIAGRAIDNEGTLTDAVIRSPYSEYADAGVTGNAVDITPQTASTTGTGEEARYTALVLPGTATGFELFSVKVGGKEATFTTDVAFEENHIYEYTLTIGEDRVVLEDLSVSDWTTNDLTAEMTPQWDGTSADSYAGGSGTQDDPYLIANAAQLAYMGKQLEKGNLRSDQYLQLTADIDLAGANWTPMGASDKPFYGHFDGGGHTIRNMNINMTEISDEYTGGYICGLFARISTSSKDAFIRNLTIEDATINVATSNNEINIGVIAGEIKTATGTKCAIDNCHIKNAKVTVNNTGQKIGAWVGGIAADAYSAKYSAPIIFSRCTVDGLTTIVTGEVNAGGILGCITNGSVQIFASSVTGTLDGNYTGGFVGYLMEAQLVASGSYADCTLNGKTSAAITNIAEDDKSQITWSYLAGRGAKALRTGIPRTTNTSSYTYKEEGCKIFTDPSEVYGIVANDENTTTFTVDGVEYSVKDCWQDNGNALPTLKVSKDGTTNN